MGEENEDVISPDTSAPENQDATHEAPATETSQVETDANSSDASSGDKEPETIADVVRDAVEKPKASAASPAEKSDEPEEGSEAEAKSGEKEEFSDIPFHTHPRFREIVKQRDEYRTGHEQYQNIQNFLDTNGIPNEEAAGMLQLLALRRQNPVQAWAQLKPMVQQLLLDAGEVLPQDLRQQVQNGRLSKEAAQLVAKERARASQAEGAVKRQQETFQRDNQARQEQSRREAVATWEARRQRDPDYAALQPQLLREVTWLKQQEGTPTTIEGINDQLDRAWKAVRTAARAQQPRRPAIQPVTGGRTSGAPAPEPKGPLDIIRQVQGA